MFVQSENVSFGEFRALGFDILSSDDESLDIQEIVPSKNIAILGELHYRHSKSYSGYHLCNSK